MQKMRLFACAFTCTVFTAFPGAASADVIYDNSVNDLLVRFNPGAFEVGDEIQLAGTARYLTNFAFEFWGENPNSSDAFDGTVEARVRFYQNNGPEFNGYATPGSAFYDSGWFSIERPTRRNTLQFVAGAQFPQSGLLIPFGATMTWSVQFQTSAAGDSTGLDLYSPAVEGASFPDYWENDGTGWQLMNNTVPMDFAALFEASGVAVPEPSNLILCLSGGAMLLFVLGPLRGPTRADPRAPQHNYVLAKPGSKPE